MKLDALVPNGEDPLQVNPTLLETKFDEGESVSNSSGDYSDIDVRNQFHCSQVPVYCWEWKAINKNVKL